MASSTSRPIVLLEAYAALTRKEATCLREESWEALIATQEKKGKLLEGLRSCGDELASESERKQFNNRLAQLKEIEEKNEVALADKMKSNRELARKLNRNTKSGSKAIRAYGKPDVGAALKGSLKDRA